MEVFLASIANEEYESMASALIEMGATKTTVDAKAFASDLEKMFSSMKASIKLCSWANYILLESRAFSKIILPTLIVLLLRQVRSQGKIMVLTESATKR